MKKLFTVIVFCVYLCSCGNSSAPRPQDPTSFPYKQEEVSINNAKSKVRLAGTLTIPSSGKVSKIVILITGSGPQNRNEEVVNHRPFLVLSDWLTRNGNAVLRYDDRGVGKSTGTFSTATTFDLADDVEAVISFIHSRHDLNKLSIGLLGHSEGGLIAPIVASRDTSVKFIVMLAGPGIPMDQLTIRQSADQNHLAGASDKTVAQATLFNRKYFTLIMQSSNISDKQLKIRVDSLLNNEALSHHLDKTKFDAAKKQYESLITPWVRTILKLNAADYLVKVKCPVLALNGTKDMQVNSQDNLSGINKALALGGNKQYKVIPVDGLNHLFQKAKTGNPNEYAKISETINPLVLKTISDWVNALSL